MRFAATAAVGGVAAAKQSVASQKVETVGSNDTSTYGCCYCCCHCRGLRYAVMHSRHTPLQPTSSPPVAANCCITHTHKHAHACSRTSTQTGSDTHAHMHTHVPVAAGSPGVPGRQAAPDVLLLRLHAAAAHLRSLWQHLGTATCVGRHCCCCCCACCCLLLQIRVWLAPNCCSHHHHHHHHLHHHCHCNCFHLLDCVQWLMPAPPDLL